MDRSSETDPHSVAIMARNWNDGRNEIFSCDPQSEEAKKVKASRRGN